MQTKSRSLMHTLTIMLTLGLAGSVGLGCGKSKGKGTKGESGPKLVVKGLDASNLKGLTMKVPQNAEVTKAMGDPSVAQISNDMGFTIWLSEGTVDLAQKQVQIEKSSFRKFISWVSKKSDSLVYRAKGITGSPEYHFLVTLKVGGKSYLCRNATSASFAEEKSVTQMAAACRTLKKK